MTRSAGRGPLQVARRARLLEVLRRDGVARISDLADAHGAAAVTVRRDVAELAAEGLARRVHGGVALPAANPGTAPLPGPTRLAGHPAAPADLPGPAHRGGADETPAPPAARGRSVGMLVPSLDHYWPDAARGVEQAARELGLRVMLRGSSYGTRDDRPQLARLLEQGADALIAAPRMDAPTADRTLDWLAGTGIPVVLLERAVDADTHHAVLESVVTDHALGAAMAVHHLRCRGHVVGIVAPARRIALIRRGDGDGNAPPTRSVLWSTSQHDTVDIGDAERPVWPTAELGRDGYDLDRPIPDAGRELLSTNVDRRRIALSPCSSITTRS